MKIPRALLVAIVASIPQLCSNVLAEPTPRSLLTSRYPVERLREVVLSRQDFKPFPLPGDPAWLKVPAAVREAHIRAAERLLGKEWPSLPATMFLDFVRTGDRERYQNRQFERRSRLGDLVLAEVFEDRGRFVDEIVDGMWLTLEETYWGVPAHVGMQRAGSGLPDAAEPTVDLFAAETASLLAWSWYLVGHKLEPVSPLIRQRLHDELNRRILTPNLERDDFWWMGFSERHVNNWNPWINSNWLSVALLAERDENRRISAIAKILRSLDRFLDSYPDDGGCDEGPGYWSRAGASLFDCLELLSLVSRDRINIYAEPLVREIGRYIYRSYIGDGYFVNFADASARPGLEPAMVFRYGTAIGDEKMRQLAAYFASREDYGAGYVRGAYGGLNRRLPALFVLEPLLSTASVEPLVRDVWLPETGVMTARAMEGDRAGFFVAAKGGHNDESHNHNDVGNFIVYYNAHPVLIDVGVGTYTRQTFSPERYTIWTMQSAYHNLPTVNGVMQQEGREFAAREVKYTENGETASLAMDLASAYPAATDLRKWNRKVTLNRASGVELLDEFELASFLKPTTLSLMTPCDVSIEGPGELQLVTGDGTQLQLGFDPDKVDAGFERIDLDDMRLSRVWGERVSRILLTVKGQPLSGVIRVALSPE